MAIGFGITGASLSQIGVLAWVFYVAGVIILVLAPGFHFLRVQDQGSYLAISFGPLSPFRRRIYYQEIEQVEPDTRTILEGWGIHYSPRGGWVWNVWGRDCVHVTFFNHSQLRIGTDDQTGLLNFLESKIKKVHEQSPMETA